ncbi:MAG: hypothetical protein ACYCT0_05415, partial [Sulfobacillus sp.]
RVSSYDKLLSTFGYDALDIIFGIDSHSLPEPVLRRLVLLGDLANKDEKIMAAIETILRTHEEADPRLKAQLLLALIDSIQE